MPEPDSIINIVCFLKTYSLFIIGVNLIDIVKFVFCYFEYIFK